MLYSEKELTGILCLGLFLGFLGGLALSSFIDRGWQKELVAKGYAEYSQKTGEWQWKKEEESSK